jgi:hypothetical protein
MEPAYRPPAAADAREAANPRPKDNIVQRSHRQPEERVKHARHSRNRTRQSALALPDNVAMRFLTAPLEHGNIIVSLRPSCLIDRNPARSRLSCRDDNETVVPDFKGLDHNGVSHW